MRGDEPFCGAHSLNHESYRDGDGGRGDSSGDGNGNEGPGDADNSSRAYGRWDPARAAELADGGLHIFSSPAGDIRETDCLAAFLGRLLHCSPHDISVVRDGFGRPAFAEPPGQTGWPPGARLCLGITADPGQQLLALMRDLPVALSVHTVPRGPVSELLLPFTPLERCHIQQAPADRRAHRLAQLWARKEAALRLTGPGGLATADEIDALSEARDGKVVIPASRVHPGGVAYVRDLPACPQTVACAATAAPAPGVRLWRPNSLEAQAKTNTATA